MLTILDLCGGSGSWSRPYAEAGYNVRLVTLPEDVRLFMASEAPQNVHGILAAPPCTVFAGSGARWKRTDEEMIEGLSIVDACVRLVVATNPVWWCLENPVGKLRHWLGPPAMYFQPYEYGDPYTKKTCLWGNFNKPVKRPMEATEGGKIHRMPPSKDRAKLRSITPPGFARAFFEANP